jgi:hypothetical protein
MKIKITLALMFVLCLALPAFAQDSMKRDDKSSGKMTPDQMLVNNEQMAWKAIQDKRWDDFAKMLADDYQGVYNDGIHDKNAETAGIKQAMINNVTLSNIKVSWINKDAAIVTAIAKGNGMGMSGKPEDFTSQTTSIWKKSGKTWMLVYHSDIMMKPM